MINSIVDKAFCITTVKSNRFNYINDHLKKNNIEFEFFVSPDRSIITDSIVVKDSTEFKSSISLTSAYVSIIEKSKLENLNSISIIEDDCFFIDGWEVRFERFLNNLPDWDLLNVGYHPMHDEWSVKERINSFVYRPLKWHNTTHCMIIKKKCFDKFLSVVKEKNYSVPVDYMFYEIYENVKKFNCFCPYEKFIYQLSYRKDFPFYEVPGTELRFESYLF